MVFLPTLNNFACILYRFMKNIALLFLGINFILLGCKKETSSVFLCDVDYVEIIDGSTARVLFQVTHNDSLKSYTLNTTYRLENRNYTIGNDLVRLENFTFNENQANFDFYYGENLGPFCATLFQRLPDHDHTPFSAEAERVLSGKGIGKWKIKRKQNITN